MEPIDECLQRDTSSGDTLKVGERVPVIKRNILGEETWRYEGLLIERGQNCFVLEAYFDRQDMQVEGLLLRKGDRFVETYYEDRWYNVFEVHACEDDRIRGWYCNISCPVKVEGCALSYIDLALDLLVFPDGSQTILDQDEFESLQIPPEARQRALDGLHELKNLF